MKNLKNELLEELEEELMEMNGKRLWFSICLAAGEMAAIPELLFESLVNELEEGETIELCKRKERHILITSSLRVINLFNLM